MNEVQRSLWSMRSAQTGDGTNLKLERSWSMDLVEHFETIGKPMVAVLKEGRIRMNWILWQIANSTCINTYGRQCAGYARWTCDTSFARTGRDAPRRE